MDYQVRIIREQDGSYRATSQDYLHLSAFGDTRAEALEEFEKVVKATEEIKTDKSVTIESFVPKGTETHRLASILTTALNEYIKARTPVHTYVQDRYQELGEDFRAKKVQRIEEDFEIIEVFNQVQTFRFEGE